MEESVFSYISNRGLALFFSALVGAKSAIRAGQGEQWKNSSNTAGNKRKEIFYGEQDEKGGDGESKRGKGSKMSKKDKNSKAHYKEKEAGMVNEPEEVDKDTNMNDHEGGAKMAQDHLRAAGQEDSDAEDDMDHLGWPMHRWIQMVRKQSFGARNCLATLLQKTGQKSVFP
ncbi:hypothetical protein COCNU_scaffold007888G000010 [Cocos nucifera]|nr:hypothetical protein [Cocos nucifera]